MSTRPIGSLFSYQAMNCSMQASSCAHQANKRFATHSSVARQLARRPQTTGTACRAAATQSQPSLQQLLNWASSNKVAVDKVAIADDLVTDAPVLVAAKDFAQGEQILSVPENVWVTPQSAQQSSIGRYLTGLEPWLQLALLLLAEQAKPGGSSKLQPYLAAAAAGSGSPHFNSPLFWSDEELQMLQGTQLLESVRGYT